MSYEFRTITVLIVEDNKLMGEVVRSLLLTFGVGHVVTAPDGETGFKSFCQFNPDIVIADWVMTPMDGISFTRLARTDPRSPNPYAPIILMTGFAQRGRMLEARDAGVTEFLIKPFTARDLYKRIVQVIERPRQFVRSELFFGPDRRRQKARMYGGPLRRTGDPTESSQIQAQRAAAHVMLERIREDAGMEKGGRYDLIFVESEDHREGE